MLPGAYLLLNYHRSLYDDYRCFFINQETHRIDNVVRWDTDNTLPTIFLDYLVLPAEGGFWLGDFYDPENGGYVKGPPPQSEDR